MQTFSPVVWPEDPTPVKAKDCTQCELSKQRNRVIWGEGNPEAKIIVILDNPGCREDRYGNSFVCGTRQTLQLAANTAGLNEKDLYITYVLKCRPLRKYQKDMARKACFGHLEQQLQKNNYGIAFCLGDVAVKTFFEDPQINVKSERGLWHRVKGLQTYVSYHPLAVRRRPNLYNIFINDWKEVARAQLIFV